MIAVHLGDITQLEVDVVVNAANPSLLGGGGVDGAIHRAAGPELLEACRQIGGCPVGDVRATDAFRLPAKRIFHTVGPVWRGGSFGEPDLLAACYKGCLALAAREGRSSIAFPAISCGVYGYPWEEAVPLAVNVVKTFQQGASALDKVVFCCFDEAVAALYELELTME